jgi:glycosyltransferase involved in cell wall biosynthesis
MSKRFVFICPTYNAEATARQAILSIAAQSYTNWHIVFVDDMSTDDTCRTVLQLLTALKLGEKITCIFNKEKKWEVENVVQALKFCKDDDIICRMDLDDYLTEVNALEILNEAYTKNPNLDVIWTAHRWFDENGLTGTNISNALPQGADPYKHPWVSSHFKTFRKHLLNGVKDENFRGADGKYFKRIGDQTFMLPALHNAKSWHYLPMPMYAYRCDMKPETFQTDDAKFQASEAEFLRKRGYIK